MNIIKKDGLETIVLNHNEEISKDLLTDKNQTRFVYQSGNLFILRESPIFSVLSFCKDNSDNKLTNEIIGESTYSPKFVYPIKDNSDMFKVPKHIIQYAMKYFRDIYDEHKCEAAVILMLNQETRDWQILKVLQVDCSGGGVNYLLPISPDADYNDNKDSRYYKEIFENPESKRLLGISWDQYCNLLNNNYTVFGSIHSHCNFAAFHSGTDDADELDFNGLHITIGNVRSGWSFSARYMLETAEFKQDKLEDYIADVTSIQDLNHNIDNVVIDPDHYKMMMPEVGKRQIQKYSQNNHFWFRKDDKVSNDEYYNWDNSYSQYSYKEISDEEDLSQYLDAKEYDENVKTFSDLQLLYDCKKDIIICVNYQYYIKNKDAFPTNRFIYIPDPSPTQNMRNKAKEYLQSKKKVETKKEKTNTKISGDKTIALFNNQHINPSFPYGNKIKSGVFINHNFGKAQKKGKK